MKPVENLTMKLLLKFENFMPSRLSLVNKTLALWLLSFLGSQQDENLKT